jgi:hypothetical protein
VLQVLPLAVELAFEPRDPRRVLELLTLPRGPFRGIAGRALASAIAEMPGIGGRPWRQAKEELGARLRESVRSRAVASGESEETATNEADEAVSRIRERIETWLEAAGHDAFTGAPREALLAVAARVRTWLRRRLVAVVTAAERDGQAAPADDVALLRAAIADAESFHEALAREERAQIDLVEARKLVEEVASRGAPHTLTLERAGRLDVADAPASVRASRDTVVFWHAVAGSEWRPSPSPWRRAERDALRRAGIALVDPAERVMAEARSWQNAALAARRRFVLAIPRHAAGASLDPHPLWDEIVARLGAGDASIARVSLEARELLAPRNRRGPDLVRPEASDAGPLPLPSARASWNAPPGLVARATRHSASSLETLLACPLHWVLTRRAGLYGGSLAAVSSGPQLNGKLGHRLVEELQLSGALGDPDRVDRELPASLERLLREEAAVLLRPGLAFERAQLTSQLTRSISALAELLAASGLEVAGVEHEARVAWNGGELHGVLDLLLRDSRGHDVVLDLKWGRSAYRRKLESGLAIQLAVYSALRRIGAKARDMPRAAYYSLSTGELLTTDEATFVGAPVLEGPSLRETWDRLEQTTRLAERTLEAGHIPVTGVGASLPLLDALEVTERDAEHHLAPEPESGCMYCAHASICGRAWEGIP